eukprot:SAG31_NODE_2351_length_5889_cov_1.999482_7_plen_173_part_00
MPIGAGRGDGGLRTTPAQRHPHTVIPVLNLVGLQLLAAARGAAPAAPAGVSAGRCRWRPGGARAAEAQLKDGRSDPRPQYEWATRASIRSSWCSSAFVRNAHRSAAAAAPTRCRAARQAWCDRGRLRRSTRIGHMADRLTQLYHAHNALKHKIHNTKFILSGYQLRAVQVRA